MKVFYCWSPSTSVADPDPGSGAFLPPGSGIRDGAMVGSGSGISKQNLLIPGSLYTKIGRIRDPVLFYPLDPGSGSGKEQWSHPNPGQNIPDPQHCLVLNTLPEKPAHAWVWEWEHRASADSLAVSGEWAEQRLQSYQIQSQPTQLCLCPKFSNGIAFFLSPTKFKCVFLRFQSQLSCFKNACETVCAYLYAGDRTGRNLCLYLNIICENPHNLL
jgi:hypothetical protein